jgi:hypothetical protein
LYAGERAPFSLGFFLGHPQTISLTAT